MTLASITTQRNKEKDLFKKFLAIGLLGSLAAHAIVVAMPSPGVWKPVEPEDSEVEVVVENEEAPPQQEEQPEVVQQPEPTVSTEPEAVALAPDVAPPPLPLAPDRSTPQPAGADAPASDDLKPLTSATGNTAIQPGGGPIISPGGQGSGFGFAKIPTGFNPFGNPQGDPRGRPDGNPGGKPGGTPGGTGTEAATRPSAPAMPATSLGAPKLACLNCPKPKYRGSEASPRVDMEVLPDGSVKVRLRKSSGNPDTDRETLETMSRWRFDPKTVPEGGTRKKVRVTYEEEGSDFQRQNEQRRRERDRQRVAEEEQKRREAERSTPTTAIKEPLAKPSDAPTPERSLPPKESAAPPPAPAPVAPAPEPAYVPPPAPEPAPVVEPPPAEVPATAPATP